MSPKLYRSADVCEAAGVQPYVLRSWEKEFPGIGVRSGDGPRLYRQSDIDRVLRIKELVFGEGLTVAGARRRLTEGRTPGASDDEPALDAAEVIEADVRHRISFVRSGLRSILELLSDGGGAASTEAPGRPAGAGGSKATGRASRATTAASKARGTRRKASPAKRVARPA